MSHIREVWDCAVGVSGDTTKRRRRKKHFKRDIKEATRPYLKKVVPPRGKEGRERK